MKTLIKVILPCLALVVLVSGKPVTDTTPLRNYSVQIDENNVVTKDFDTCMPPGSNSFTLSWSPSYKYAKLIVNYGFSVTSTNPYFNASGMTSHTWTINAVQIVEYGLEVSNNGTSWTTLIGGLCIPVCDQPEQCE